MDLLLGTDVIPRLGFALIQVSEKASEDLLGRTPQCSEASGSCIPAQETSVLPDGRTTTSDLILPTSTTSKRETPSAAVRLIQATKLPGRHSKLIQAAVQNMGTGETTLLFQPDQKVLGTKGVSVADAVVTPGKTVTLLVSNFGCEPVQLEDGEVFGQLEPAVVMDTSLQANEAETSEVDSPGAGGEVGDVAAIQMTHDDRKKQLLEALCLDDVELPEDGQRAQLYSLVLEFAEGFALDQTELGCTSVVTHKIDTGDHLPIKQLPR